MPHAEASRPPGRPTSAAPGFHAYLEHPPPRPLRPFVDAFWTQVLPAAEGGVRSHRVLPDGCLDIILDLSPDTRAAYASVVGAMTKPLDVRSPGPVRLVAVRFRPGGAYPFLGQPLHPLADRHLDLGDLGLPWEGLERIAEAGGPREQVESLAALLLRRLEAGAALRDRRVLATVQALHREPGGRSVRALSEEVGLSRQHLTLRFKEQVGLAPKQLARVLRMRRAMAYLRSPRPGINGAGVAAAAGYYDQAHMIAEIKALTGSPPGAWMTRLP